MYELILIFLQSAFALKLDQSDMRMVNIKSTEINKATMNHYCKDYGTQYSQHTFGIGGALSLDCVDDAGAIMPFLFEESDLTDLRRVQWGQICTKTFGSSYKFAGAVEDITGSKPLTTILCNRSSSSASSESKSDLEVPIELLESLEKYKPNTIGK
jgi:hypothetical protein